MWICVSGLHLDLICVRESCGRGWVAEQWQLRWASLFQGAGWAPFSGAGGESDAAVGYHAHL